MREKNTKCPNRFFNAPGMLRSPFDFLYLTAPCPQNNGYERSLAAAASGLNDPFTVLKVP